MKKKEFETKKKMTVAELAREISELKRKFVEVSAKISAGREKNLKAGKALRLQIAKLNSLMATKAGKEEK